MSRYIALSVLLVTAMAHAQTADHLKCYKVKPDTKVKGLVDLLPEREGLLPERDCKVVGPTLFCVAVEKTNVRVEPPPPGAPAGPQASERLCYKLKCPKPFPSPVVASDQFGTFNLTFKGTSL